MLQIVLDALAFKKTDFPGGGSVSYYFYMAFKELWDGGMRDDFLSLRNQYPDYDVWVCKEFGVCNDIFKGNWAFIRSRYVESMCRVYNLFGVYS